MGRVVEEGERENNLFSQLRQVGCWSNTCQRSAAGEGVGLVNSG